MYLFIHISFIYLTLSFPKFPFDPSENIKKAFVFLCFQGDQKKTLARKRLNSPVFNNGKKICIQKSRTTSYPRQIY